AALAAVTPLLACSLTAPDSGVHRDITRQVDARVERAIAEKKIPGGIYHLEQNGKIYEKVYGNRALEPAVEAMTVDTIFDVASITKVAATTPAIWLLIQRGKIGLDDP